MGPAEIKFDRPVVSPTTVATETAWALEGGCIAVNVQNTHSSLTIGIHMLLLNEMIWHPTVTVEEFLNDWFAHAFRARDTTGSSRL